MRAPPRLPDRSQTRSCDAVAQLVVSRAATQRHAPPGLARTVMQYDASSSAEHVEDHTLMKTSAVLPHSTTSGRHDTTLTVTRATMKQTLGEMSTRPVQQKSVAYAPTWPFLQQPATACNAAHSRAQNVTAKSRQWRAAGRPVAARPARPFVGSIARTHEKAAPFSSICTVLQAQCRRPTRAALCAQPHHAQVATARPQLRRHHLVGWRILYDTVKLGHQ